MSENILVIKLGALGDFVQATIPFAAIRAHHGHDRITLLTTEPFADFAAKSPWFNHVITDTRPKQWRIDGWLKLRATFRAGGFSRVYDLQTSDRSGFYYKLFWPDAAPEWSGIAAGCSHPHANPKRDDMHTIERQREQLAMAGVKNRQPVKFGWIADYTSKFELSEPFALLVPGGAAHRPKKRWPIDSYAELARYLAEQGVQPVVIGGRADQTAADTVTKAVPSAIDLTGQTDLEDLFVLAHNARAAIGNDTGPMHPIALTGCPSLVLFSSASDPALCAQRGDAVTIMQRDNLIDLRLEDVIQSPVVQR